MSSNRIVIALLAIIVVAPIAAASAFVSVLTFLDTCDGDGGYPYSAPASVAGRFCDSPASTPYFIAEFALPVLIAVGFAISAGIRRKLSRLAIGLGTSLAVLLTMGVVVGSLPDGCSQEQQRADPYNC
jgi:hypothetical protein